MWDKRFDTDEYIYGTEPNKFLCDNLDKIGQNVLLPADGEGRNAVFLASKNIKVTSFDSSKVALQKANKLAEQKNVSINAILSNAENFNFQPQHYDTIVLCYFHMEPEIRAEIHEKCVKSLKEGGTLILEGFSKEQIKNDSGGPKDVERLFSNEMLIEDFKDLKICVLETKNIYLNEGSYHNGLASVVRFIGKKHEKLKKAKT